MGLATKPNIISRWVSLSLNPSYGLHPNCWMHHPHATIHRMHSTLERSRLRTRPPRLDARGRARAVRAAVPGAAVPRAGDAPAELRSDRSADLDAALDQDRRLPGGLRLLSAERALRHRRQGREADGPRRGARRGARGQGRGREPLLHGRGLAQPEGPRSRFVCAMVEGVKALGLETCATLGMLTAPQAGRLQAGRPRLLQPQPRHLAGVLRGDHHHAHLSGSARHARAMCVRPASTCAAAASSAWARPRRTASA